MPWVEKLLTSSTWLKLASTREVTHSSDDLISIVRQKKSYFLNTVPGGSRANIPHLENRILSAI
jgi:hypothetical protein